MIAIGKCDYFQPHSIITILLDIFYLKHPYFLSIVHHRQASYPTKGTHTTLRDMIGYQTCSTAYGGGDDLFVCILLPLNAPVGVEADGAEPVVGIVIRRGGTMYRNAFYIAKQFLVQSFFVRS